MKTQFVQHDTATFATELLVAFAINTADKKDKQATPRVELLHADPAVTSAAAAILTTGEFAAASCETILIHAPAGLAATRLLVVGVSKPTAHDLRKAAGTAIRFAKPRSIRAVTLLFPDKADADAKLAGRALAEGAILADYDSDTYKSDRVDRSLESSSILAGASAPPAIQSGIEEGIIIAEAQNFARTLVNEPGNYLTPTILGQRAAAMANANGLKAEVYGADKLHELKMGAFWSVSQGSPEPPALIVLTYEPANPKPGAPVLGLVGKGITFDTGGISIKPADGMEKMKYDMAGGAAMLGAMQAIAALKPSIKVIAIVCAAENMPSGTAQKPGDIQTAMSGKTIEIVNTDAEGRLVLADGLTYAKQLGATHLINAATLTGAVGIALGTLNGGVFSNNDETYAKFVTALETSGERFWRLPVEDDYRDQIKSQIADIMNTGATRHGGAINAAMFLKEFAEDTPWIHLDIAAVAWTDKGESWLAKGPTGVAVRSILEWVRSYSA